jgi:hypothetical protein
MAGITDQHTPATSPSRLINRHASLTQVEAIGFYSQSDIDPAIDKEFGSKLPGHTPEHPSQVGVLIVREIFFPQLNGTHSTTQGIAHHVRQRPATGLATVRNQIQGKIDRFHEIMGKNAQKAAWAKRASPLRRM